MRRTKIVCTIGPVSRSPEMVEKLVRSGMDVARLNASHGTLAQRIEDIGTIREVSDRLGKPVAILQDLAGPKVRIGSLADGPVTLRSGERFVLTSRDVPGDAYEVSLTYKGLPADVRVGDTLLLADGAIELSVDEVTGEDIACRVVVGGRLSSHKGINLPSRSVNTLFLTEKDRRDLTSALKHGVDYVALSFVRNAEDVAQARGLIEAAGCDVPIVAKIEKHEALHHIDAILEVVDGIMIARGDLGVEIPAERVPRIQKTLITKANQASKPVITATQMLKSMVDNPRPTRAEVADVANAVFDGSDAVMLSEESAVGQYPDLAVQMMSRIADDAEVRVLSAAVDAGSDVRTDCPEAVASAACRLAHDVRAAAIIVCTQSGSTARLVARNRPEATILAMTPLEPTCRRLSLVWGVIPMVMAPAEDQEAMEARAMTNALQSGHVKPGDAVVITAGLPLHATGTTNSIKMLVAES